MSTSFAVGVPWHREAQRDLFLSEWEVGEIPSWLILQQDYDRSGCAVTKNRGIRKAIDMGAEVVCVLDDDCFPRRDSMRRIPEIMKLGLYQPLLVFAQAHIEALQPQEVELYRLVPDPPSRGTPYYRRSVRMPVAASMGFWENVPDLCAPAQLVRGPTCPMTFDRRTVYGQPFAYCGMNVAFRAEWWPWCSFADLQRVDDIFAGYIFQKEAYRRGYCFNLAGPVVHHSRQSNVWRNLEDEVKYLERNETLWSDIMFHPSNDYDTLLKLLPEKK